MSRRLLLVLVAVALVAFADQKAAAPKVVSAERFDLVDASGKVRLRIGMAGTDPAIALRDENGMTRAMIAITGSAGAAVELKDARGALASLLEWPKMADASPIGMRPGSRSSH